MDCTIFDEEENETPIPEIYSASNVLVVRIDIVRSRMEEGIHMEAYRE